MQGPEGNKPYEILPDNANANGEKVPIASASMIRSHSISGDLHGVQPDPIAADILRKEPEQETFARLRITPIGIKISHSFQCNKLHNMGQCNEFIYDEFKLILKVV